MPNRRVDIARVTRDKEGQKRYYAQGTRLENIRYTKGHTRNIKTAKLSGGFRQHNDPFQNLHEYRPWTGDRFGKINIRKLCPWLVGQKHG